MRSRTLLLLSVLMAVGMGASSVCQASDGLTELYRPARAKDPVLGRAAAQMESTRAEKDIVRATLLPRIDASASISWITNQTFDYKPETIRGSYTGDYYGVNLRQPLLYLPGVYNLNAAGAALEATDEAVKGAEQQLIVTLADAYFTLLKARADEQLYRDDMTRLSRVLQQAEAYLKNGTGDIIAVYESRARLDSSAADLVKATNVRRSAEQKLDSVVGRPVTGVKDLGGYAPRGAEPSDLGWWLDYTVKNQPLLRQQYASLRQAEAQIQAAQAGHLPVIQLTGGYTASKGSTFLPEVETRQWSVGLSMSVPLFSGGDTSARIRRAAAYETEQRFILDGTKEQLIQKLKDAYLNLEYNASLIKALQQKKASAELQLTAVTKGRTIGTRTVIDQLNAEQSYAISLRDLKNALYDNAVYNLHLKAAAGILAEKDLQELNSYLVDAAALPVSVPAGLTSQTAKGETP